MSEHQQRALKFTNRVAIGLSMIGLIVFVYSFFVSGTTADYVMYSGIGVVIASVFLYMFGLVLALVEEKGHSQV